MFLRKNCSITHTHKQIYNVKKGDLNYYLSNKRFNHFYVSDIYCKIYIPYYLLIYKIK